MNHFATSIKNLMADNHSGSGALLEGLITAIEDLARNSELGSGIDAVMLREKLSAIREEKPLFLVLHHFIDEVIGMTGKASRVPARQLSEFTDRYRKQWSHTETSIASNLQRVTPLQGKTVLLHSNSTTVCGVFGEPGPSGSRIRIIQTESRPVNEGRLQAEYLAKLGHEVTLVTDATIARVLREADLALLGADAVFRNHFINKMGTYSIALACREFNKECLVVCDSRKMWLKQSGLPAKEASPELSAPSAEVWKNAPEGVSVENHYFEQTPNDLVSSFIFEDRVVAGDRIRDLEQRG